MRLRFLLLPGDLVARAWELLAHDGLGRIPAVQRFNDRVNAWGRRRARRLWPLVDQLRAVGLQEQADDLALTLVDAPAAT